MAMILYLQQIKAVLKTKGMLKIILKNLVKTALLVFVLITYKKENNNCTDIDTHATHTHNIYIVYIPPCVCIQNISLLSLTS